MEEICVLVVERLVGSVGIVSERDVVAVMALSPTEARSF